MQYRQDPMVRELYGVFRQIDEFYHEVAAAQGLSDSAYTVLQTVLVQGEGCTQTEICRRTFLNKQTVNSSVRKLREDGILRLEKGRGREAGLYLTERGARVVRERVLPLEEAERRAFAGMSAGDRADILRLTRLYLDAIRAEVRGMESGQGSAG